MLAQERDDFRALKIIDANLHDGLCRGRLRGGFPMFPNRVSQREGGEYERGDEKPFGIETPLDVAIDCLRGGCMHVCQTEVANGQSDEAEYQGDCESFSKCSDDAES